MACGTNYYVGGFFFLCVAFQRQKASIHHISSKKKNRQCGVGGKAAVKMKRLFLSLEVGYFCWGVGGCSLALIFSVLLLCFFVIVISAHSFPHFFLKHGRSVLLFLFWGIIFLSRGVTLVFLGIRGKIANVDFCGHIIIARQSVLARWKTEEIRETFFPRHQHGFFRILASLSSSFFGEAQNNVVLFLLPFIIMH